MPFFQFTATNSQGQPMQGQVQAGSLEEANRALTQQGYRVSDLRESNRLAPNAPSPSPNAQRPVANAPSIAPNAQRPTPNAQHINTPAPKPKRHRVKTRYGTEKDTFFLFSQLAALFKSGVNASQAFHDLGMRNRRSDYREAMMEVSRNVIEGGSIADTLERYPYLFAPHVVGTVRAGEVGGYLPEAFETISSQADSSRKFRRWFVWLGWAVVSVLICVPIGKAFTDGAVNSWDVQEKSGGMAPGGATLLAQIWQLIKWPIGPLTILVTLIFIAVSYIWQSMRFRELRHRLVLLAPAATKRAKSESFAAFSWNLSNLARSGIAPHRAWELASATVPNQAIRASLDAQGAQMTEQTKLSEALFNTRMIPHEYSALVQTGEITGDVPGQLMQAARMSQDEFGIHDKMAKGRVGCWILIVSFGIGTLVIYALYGGFWTKLIPKIIGE
ncbi:MAG: hypothetical protein BGO01_19040 [Armatimonadetes bacterium 55-13]|nr:type II secretion system F family protein [Armatimonadota bacterium]ODU53746.1 MAG: hypothetical protein ABT09_01190 [bacterium SCN 57-13]OJU64218.1 MAG: hypothetical protein BGO01_19040 [Armatimonadetes bacterium 55-13]